MTGWVSELEGRLRQPESDAQTLERFVLDNPDLERLESVLGDFNPFVALRWIRQETRHSQFLRWLFDPNETHGLGSYALRAFAKRLAARATGRSGVPSVVDVDSASFGTAQVLTEWNNVDLLIRDEEAGFLLLIENKVDSSEHSQQLQRYRRLAEEHYPSFKKLFVLLTVEGDTPSDEGYVAMTYAEVAAVVAEVAERRSGQLGPDVAGFMAHYVEMLRRHIVEDSEIQALCQRIYQTHRRALDVIFEHRPDKTLELSEYLRSQVEARSVLALDQCSKAYIRFWPQALDFLPKIGSGWTRTGRLILFEIDLSASDVGLKVVLGPGPQEVRDSIHDWIKAHPEPFNRANSRFYPQWWSFHSDRWLNKSRFEASDSDDLRKRVGTRLAEFLDGELPRMQQALHGLAELGPWKDGD